MALELLEVAGVGLSMVVGVSSLAYRWVQQRSGQVESAAPVAEAAREALSWRETVLATEGAGTRLALLLDQVLPALEASLGERCRIDRDAGIGVAVLKASLAGYPFELEVWSTGWIERLQVVGPCPFGPISLWRVERVLPPELERVELGEGVFLEAPAADCRTLSAQWEALNAALRGELLRRMAVHRLTAVHLADRAVAIRPADKLLDPAVDDPVGHLLSLVDTLRVAVKAAGRLRAAGAPPDPEPFGAGDAAAPIVPASDDPHAVRLAGYWRRPPVERADAVRPLFDALAAEVDRPAILLPADHREGHAELRCRIDGAPVKLSVDARGAWRAEVHTAAGHLARLRYDPVLPPARPPEETPPVDGPLRVYVARGVYVDGDAADVVEAMPPLQALPEHVLLRVTKSFSELGLASVTLAEHAVVTPAANLAREPTPLAKARRVLRLAADLWLYLGENETRRLKRARCEACWSHYLHVAGREYCVNCGAFQRPQTAEATP